VVDDTSASSQPGAAVKSADSSRSSTAAATRDAASTAATTAVSQRVGTIAGDSSGITSGDALHDIREMIKILNLAAPDAARLGISREEFAALRPGNTAGNVKPATSSTMPSADKLDEVADRLRRMLA
jgi:hypothetical protein